MTVGLLAVVWFMAVDCIVGLAAVVHSMVRLVVVVQFMVGLVVVV